jgi:hypothetical protein
MLKDVKHMKNKKIIYLVISIFLLTSLTALSVSGAITQKNKGKNLETTEETYRFAWIDGTLDDIDAIQVKGIEGPIGFLNTDITVEGKVYHTEDFTIKSPLGSKTFTAGETVDMHIGALLFSGIGIVENAPPQPHTIGISGLAIGLTIN